MGKREKIDRMAAEIPDYVQYGGTCWELSTPDAYGFRKRKAIASELVNAGYGNLREFVEYLKKVAEGQGGVVYDMDIDELLKEFTE